MNIYLKLSWYVSRSNHSLPKKRGNQVIDMHKNHAGDDQTKITVVSDWSNSYSRGLGQNSIYLHSACFHTQDNTRFNIPLLPPSSYLEIMEVIQSKKYTGQIFSILQGYFKPDFPGMSAV